MTSAKAPIWRVGRGGRVAHAWHQVGTYISEFAALCDPSLLFGNGWTASGYKRCGKCEKLVSVQSQEKGRTDA